MDGRPSTILAHAILSICTFAICQVKNFCKQRNARPYVNAEVEGITTTALFDSGADVSCISEKAF
jgi:hypothetical protein